MYVFCKECYVCLIFSECNCHGHADSCVYNSTVDRLGLSLNMNGEYKGGGVCIDCKVSIYIIALWVCRLLCVQFHGGSSWPQSQYEWRI